MKHWQQLLQASLSHPEELAARFKIDPAPLVAVAAAYPMRINPYYLNLIRRPGDPLWCQAVPDVRELTDRICQPDPLNEEQLSPVPNLVHKYPDRALFLVNDQCAMYCRFCTRKRKVGTKRMIITSDTIKAGLDYLGRTPEIRDVLLELRGTGTTIFLNSHLLSEIEMICDRVAILDHGKILRVGDVQELTRRRDRWRIAVEGSVDAARAVLEETCSPDVVRGALEFSATSAEELNAAIDLLRAKGVLIREVHAVSASLEEAFLEIVGHSREEAS